MIKTKQNKLGTYLTVTAGVGCAASAANAAVVFYGINSANDQNADPIGIEIAVDYFNYVDNGGTRSSLFNYDINGAYFTRGADLNGSAEVSPLGSYFGYGSFAYGAVAGDQNFANIDFNDDGVFEAVGQFSFDGVGGGFLVAIATTNDITNPQDLSNVGGPALSISAGVAEINAASVPEPSSLALLALGAAGLISRRQRKAA